MSIDFGKTAQDYGRHRAGFPPAFFQRVFDAWAVGAPGQRLLDLGTGAGTLARGFALRGCRVAGLDPSEPLLEQARALDNEAGARIDYHVGRAEGTGLAGESFDAVSAGQCWHWFESAQAAAEVLRLLVPGGQLIIAHFDWLPLPGNMVEATEVLIHQHNPAWGMGGQKGMYPQWLMDMGAAGFTELESFSFDIDQPYSHEAWRGRIRASAGVAASLSPDQVERFDGELQVLLNDQFPGEPLLVPHRVFAARGRRP